MRNCLALLLSLFFVSCTSTGSGSDAGSLSGQTYYALCTLHPDPAKQTLASINFLQAGLIPRGSQVTVNSQSRKRIEFTVVDSGVKYAWNLNRNTTTSLAENFEKYFGSQSDLASTEGMSELDLEGIRLGNVTVGMTKQGVLLAVGSPPEHATPSLDLPVWSYWKNNWARRLVTFDANGVVIEVKG